MAGDWIKMRCSLDRDHRVIAMARFLADDDGFRAWWVQGTPCSEVSSVLEIANFQAVTRVTYASLLALWARTNELTHDGFLRGATLFELDEMAGVPSIGAAMVRVGWAVESEAGVLLPNFLEHNNPQRNREAKTDADRAREYRARKKSKALEISEVKIRVTETSLRHDREEKNREEIKTPPKPPKTKDGYSALFARFWEEYPRKESKAEALKAFAKHNPDEWLLEVLLQAIRRQKKHGCLEPRTASDGRSVIPHPSTWLNGKRWEDEAPSQGVNGLTAEQRAARDESLFRANLEGK